MRHFRSLRQLERDHGFIFTLLEEAENERMHLIVCMSFFEAGPFTRFIVQAGQIALTPFLAGLYMIRPQLLHRFVGYLEETAVHTYTNIVNTTNNAGHGATRCVERYARASGGHRLLAAAAGRDVGRLPQEDARRRVAPP